MRVESPVEKIKQEDGWMDLGWGSCQMGRYIHRDTIFELRLRERNSSCGTTPGGGRGGALNKVRRRPSKISEVECKGGGPDSDCGKQAMTSDGTEPPAQGGWGGMNSGTLGKATEALGSFLCLCPCPACTLLLFLYFAFFAFCLHCVILGRYT